MNNAQYTIRDISPKTDATLRARARRRHKSLNATLVEILDQAASTQPKNPGAATPHHDFDDLSGTWTADPDFDQAMQDVRTVDPKEWQ